MYSHFPFFLYRTWYLMNICLRVPCLHWTVCVGDPPIQKQYLFIVLLWLLCAPGCGRALVWQTLPTRSFLKYQTGNSDKGVFVWVVGVYFSKNIC